MISAAALKLKDACDYAYNNFQKYCNQSVHSVIVTLVDPAWPLELADDMINRIVAKGWIQVPYLDAADFANDGKVVVAGLRGGENGHVVVVYPGDMKPMGGFECNGVSYPALGGPFPLSMSTSVSKWCGTHSKGDKTIRDAWSAADWPNVKCWRQPD